MLPGICKLERGSLREFNIDNSVVSPHPTMMRNGLPAMAPVPLDLDFEKTEMKYDSTGMFHWTPSRPIDDCILVRRRLET